MAKGFCGAVLALAMAFGAARAIVPVGTALCATDGVCDALYPMGALSGELYQ